MDKSSQSTSCICGAFTRISRKHGIFIIKNQFLFLLLINCDKSKESEIIKDSNNTSSNNSSEIESETEKEADSGFFITENTFDEKLKLILEEKNLKPKKKITKQQLRHIFELIYKSEKNENEEDNKNEEKGIELGKEENSKEYMDSIFNEATKSLDYDDKIRVREIKEWINPARVQAAYAELLQGLAESMGYL